MRIWIDTTCIEKDKTTNLYENKHSITQKPLLFTHILDIHCSPDSFPLNWREIKCCRCKFCRVFSTDWNRRIKRHYGLSQFFSHRKPKKKSFVSDINQQDPKTKTNRKKIIARHDSFRSFPHFAQQLPATCEHYGQLQLLYSTYTHSQREIEVRKFVSNFPMWWFLN